MKDAIVTDVVIIGAGPVGLFQVFELGLLDIKAHVIETLEKPGGQCSELYPDKPIYDIPAIPKVSAQELTDGLLAQIAPFEPTFHFDNEVTQLESTEGDRFLLKTSKGLSFDCRAVIIAAGMGSFQPVRLKLPGVDTLENQSVFYSVKNPEIHRGKDIVVLGGGDSALDWVLALLPVANSVTQIHRSTRFRAAPASVKRVEKLAEQLQLQSEIGTVCDFSLDDQHRLAGIKVTGNDGVTRKMGLDHLLVFFGLSPKLGVIAEWELDMVKNQIQVDTARFETSRKGIYAVGDINSYPGKKKLILSGFHEAALAAYAVKEQLEPDRKVHLQYTTTSPVMHQRLGVNDPYSEDAVA